MELSASRRHDYPKMLRRSFAIENLDIDISFSIL